MQTLKRSDIEAELMQRLQEAEVPYRRALLLFQQCLPHSSPEMTEITNCLRHLEPLMRQTAEIEKRLALCRERWLALGVPAQGEFKQVLDRHQQLLGELVARVNAVDERTRALRTASLPGLDRYVRHQQMQRAYQH